MRNYSALGTCRAYPALYSKAREIPSTASAEASHRAQSPAGFTAQIGRANRSRGAAEERVSSTGKNALLGNTEGISAPGNVIPIPNVPAERQSRGRVGGLGTMPSGNRDMTLPAQPSARPTTPTAPFCRYFSAAPAPTQCRHWRANNCARDGRERGFSGARAYAPAVCAESARTPGKRGK